MAEGIVTVERGLSLNLDYDGQAIRMVGTADRPEWVLADVCRVLGIENAAKAVRGFKPTEKGVTIGNTLGGPQQMLTVTEPGLLKLICKSRKPEAVAFQTWVFHVVLPCVLKHGCYPAPDFEAGTRVLVTIDEQALGRAIGQHMGVLGGKIEGVAADVCVLKSDMAAVKSELSRISRRREITATTRRTHDFTIFCMFHGYCPCCGLVLIVGENGKPLTTLVYEHFNGPGKNLPQDTWATCVGCNRDLESQEHHDKCRKVFDVYQDRRRHLQRMLNPTFPAFGDLEV